MNTTSRIAALLAAAAAGLAGGLAAAPDRTVVQHPVVRGIRPADIKVPKQSAVHPDGYAPAKAPPPTAFLGASIRVSPAGARLIEFFEGFGSCPYWDPFGGVWTRGYGETDFGGNFGGRCVSRSQAQANLIGSVNSQYLWAARDLGVNLNQNQVDSLASTLWNLGAGIIGRGTTLGSLLRAHNFGGYARVLLSYDHAGGQVLEGLRTRRIREARLFLTPGPVAETAAQRAARLHGQLAATNVHIRRIRLKLTAHRCRVVHGRRAFRLCPAYAHEGRILHARAARLRREGAR